MTAPKFKRVERNQRGRDIICGDVHGNFTGLQAALDSIGFDPDCGDRLFIPGDLVDRGSESELALDWLAKPWLYVTRGNHEQMAIDHVAGFSDTGCYVLNGGAWFLGLTREEQRLFADAFSALPIAIELQTATGIVGLVHAECPFRDFGELDDALTGEHTEGVEVQCLWSRARFNYRSDGITGGVRAVVVGHTPMRESVTLGNHIYIDTMGWRDGGFFTLLDAETLKPATQREGA